MGAATGARQKPAIGSGASALSPQPAIPGGDEDGGARAELAFSVAMMVPRHERWLRISVVFMVCVASALVVPSRQIDENADRFLTSSGCPFGGERKKFEMSTTTRLDAAKPVRPRLVERVRQNPDVAS